MKVRFMGFTWDIVSKSLNLAGWAAHAHVNRPNLEVATRGQRLLMLDNITNKNYILGLVITVKDQRRFCQMVRGVGGAKVQINDLAADAGLMDFNFFVVNKDTGAGMYQHYHQSFSVSGFCEFVKKDFARYKESLNNRDIELLADDQKSEGNIKKIRKKNSGRLAWALLVRKEKLKQLLESLKRVSSFEYALATPQVIENEFKPLSEYIRAKSTRIGFLVGSPVGVIAESISNYVKSGEAKSGKVEGVDADGKECVISILDNPDNFGEFEYDDVAIKLNELNLDKFQDSWVIRELLGSCEKNVHIFGAKRKP